MKIIITGFGPFGSIKENPASVVAKAVANNMRQRKIQIQFQQIQTSIQDVLDFYQKLNEKDVFVIHIGVYDGSHKPQIETKAHNIADFGIPDVRGNQPKRQKIIKTLELGAVIPQCFDFKTILPQNIDINYSDDAGEYICNYCFVHALENVGKKTVGTTFIHIPNFNNYPFEKSVEVISNFVMAINMNCNKFKGK